MAKMQAGGIRGQKQLTMITDETGGVINRLVQTKLVGREEQFKFMLLCELLGLPGLMEGTPGVAKSQLMTDYSGDHTGRSVFIIELDAGTRPSEVKGYIDMKALAAGEYKTLSRIADSHYILINEVDKATQDIRNTLLSVMRERELQLGSEGVKRCNWKIFVGTCNEIPVDERKSPFWDRFMLKQIVGRVGASRFPDIWARRTYQLELQADRACLSEARIRTDVDFGLVYKLLEIIYGSITDRTATHIPLIWAGVKEVWGLDDQAECAIRVCEMVAPTELLSVTQKLMDAEYVQIKSYIENAGRQTRRNMAEGLLKQAREAVNKWNKGSESLKAKLLGDIDQAVAWSSTLPS